VPALNWSADVLVRNDAQRRHQGRLIADGIAYAELHTKITAFLIKSCNQKQKERAICTARPSLNL
jgi:hypothetical protein